MEAVGASSSVWRLATEWKVRDLNPGGGKRFACLHTRPDRPWGLFSHLYSAYRSSFQGVKRPKRGFDIHPPSSVEVNIE